MTMSRFHWGWRIGLVYTAFALSTLGFVAFAMTQRVDLVRDDYYQESLRTAAAQAELHRGRMAGIVLRVDDAKLIIRMPYAPDGSLSVHLYRPDNPALDQQMKTTVGDDGVAIVPLHGADSGRWRVIARWVYGGQSYVYEQTILVQ